MVEHLRCLRTPHAGTRHGLGDAAGAVGAFQGIGDRLGKDAADKVAGDGLQQTVEQARRNTGPGSIVDKYPVIGGDLASNYPEAILDSRGARFTATAQDAQLGEIAPVIAIPITILRGDGDKDPGDGGVPLEGAEGMPEHRPTGDIQVLLGQVDAHAGADAGGGK